MPKFNIDEYINKLWTKFDDNDNGVLDKEEAKEFYKHCVVELKGKKNFRETHFLEWFDIVDTDGSGTIEKDEMTDCIKRLLGY